MPPLGGPCMGEEQCMGIKVLLSLGDELCGTLLVVDGLDLSFRKVKIGKDLKCPICNAR